MWCLCQSRSPLASGAVCRGMFKGDLSSPVFMVRLTQSQSNLGRKSTYRTLLMMEMYRLAQDSTGVRSCSRNIPMKGAGG